MTAVQLVSALFTFVAFSVIGGFLLAGIALPAATVGASAASGTSDLFEDLPDEPPGRVPVAAVEHLRARRQDAARHLL
ncbi:hypothetical protein GCM10025876_21590 [Demequina litorisediminis]|uniref:Uncharacterized protein n=1 Tax=Demequina litorisediminis TaxID=1849022 RepID=A0ABQ6IF93_9MICO|nr:hypothetical protein GCM10025876_21590 [Demequina litorisediminis]